MIGMDVWRLVRCFTTVNRESGKIELQCGKLPCNGLDFNLAAGDGLQFRHYAPAHVITESQFQVHTQRNHHNQQRSQNQTPYPPRARRSGLLWCFRYTRILRSAEYPKVHDFTSGFTSDSIFIFSIWVCERSVCSQAFSSPSMRCSTSIWVILSETLSTGGTAAPCF